MRVIPTDIPDVLIVEPRVFEDSRGFFLECYQRRRYAESGIDVEFVQDNHSRSKYGTLRGLHYQIEHPQGKLCRVIAGKIFDVAVDLRRRSPTFGRWTSNVLSADSHRQVWVPPGFAHGFCVLSETAEFLYKCTDYYSPAHERTLLWNDSALGIPWPVSDPELSDKDRRGVPLRDAPCFE